MPCMQYCPRSEPSGSLRTTPNNAEHRHRTHLGTSCSHARIPYIFAWSLQRLPTAGNLGSRSNKRTSGHRCSCSAFREIMCPPPGRSAAPAAASNAGLQRARTHLQTSLLMPCACVRHDHRLGPSGHAAAERSWELQTNTPPDITARSCIPVRHVARLLTDSFTAVAAQRPQATAARRTSLLIFCIPYVILPPPDVGVLRLPGSIRIRSEQTRLQTSLLCMRTVHIAHVLGVQPLAAARPASLGIRSNAASGFIAAQIASCAYRLGLRRDRGCQQSRARSNKPPDIAAHILHTVRHLTS
jgi:hypothetical protein